MPGGMMQLLSQGGQNIFLIGNPSLTFFKTVYRRHTKFGAEYITLFFDPAPTFTPTQSTSATCKINRNADLIYDCYLSYELPAIYTNNEIPFGWCDSVGTKIINETSIRFDGTLIERQTGDYMKVYNELITNETERKKYDELVGNVDYLKNSGQQLSDDISEQDLAILAYKLYVPFSFWFCKNSGSSIPLVALQYNEAFIDVTYNQLNDLIRIGNPLVSPQQLFGDYDNSAQNIKIRDYFLENGYDQTNVIYYFTQNNWSGNSTIVANYIFLGEDEQRAFAQTSHEYLITQTQYNLFQGLKRGPNYLETTFSNPIIEIIWYLTRDDLYLRNDWYNFTGLIEYKTLNYVFEYFNKKNIYTLNKYFLENEYNGSKEFLDEIKAASVGNLTNIQMQTYFNGYENIMDTFQPVLNNNDRQEVFDSNFYRNLSQWKYHTGKTSQPVYLLSFSLEPEKIQPSGSLNFSFLNKQEFRVNIRDTYPVEEKFNCYMYARNYNVLRIIGGIGSIVFAN
jgi:hypothetical protein